MDIAQKTYIITEVLRMIPGHSSLGKLDYWKALCKRFPKAFKLTRDDVDFKPDQLSDREAMILIRAINNPNNISGGGKFFLVSNFWDDLVEDKRVIADRAIDAIAEHLGCSRSNIQDVVHHVEYGDLVVFMKDGAKHRVIALRRARALFRKDHYKSMWNNHCWHYGPLFNWL